MCYEKPQARNYPNIFQLEYMVCKMWLWQSLSALRAFCSFKCLFINRYKFSFGSAESILFWSYNFDAGWFCRCCKKQFMQVLRCIMHIFTLYMWFMHQFLWYFWSNSHNLNSIMLCNISYPYKYLQIEAWNSFSPVWLLSIFYAVLEVWQ